MIPVVLGLGSNTIFNGLDSLHILAAACNELKNLFAPYAEKMIISSVYRTKALYVTDQSDFYNMAVYCFVSDSCTPHSLLEKIHVIEARYGRDRSREIRFGPRPLDIDIELFGKRTVNEPDLQIPHPRLSERAFVLTPMLEILPVSADCVNRELFAGYLRRLPDQGVCLYMDSAQFRQHFFPEAADGNRQKPENGGT